MAKKVFRKLTPEQIRKTPTFSNFTFLEKNILMFFFIKSFGR